MNAHDQAGYQVRFEWGAAGLARLVPADVVVVVDVLDPGAEEAAVAAAAARGGAVVLRGSLANADAVAQACLALQHERSARTSVALIAVGARDPHDDDGDAPLRFAVEDLLGAGAVIAALSARGTDHTSPEAAAACEAAVGLRRAVGNLVSASGTGRELAASGRAAEVSAASLLDSSDAVPRWRDGAWVTLV